MYILRVSAVNLSIKHWNLEYFFPTRKSDSDRPTRIYFTAFSPDILFHDEIMFLHPV